MLIAQRYKPFFTLSLLFTGLFLTNFEAFSREGMFLPTQLKDREKEMKSLGLEIPIEKLYNENGTGLNNAIVLFGGGCTGEIISPQGLLLTNHHCGYGTVQGLSSRENDYFANGFWAMSLEEELPCPGLTVTFIRKMENVTESIISDIPDTLDDTKRNTLISGRITALEKGYKYTTGLDATIKPFYNGNQYFVILSETFRDIRLTGFPPNGIGQFGGDTDNWMWPRHTGDFSVFRVYAGKDNKPADYHPDNVPYKTDNYFTINISGYKEGDFTMVYGFPGTTQEYISEAQLNQIYDIVDPIRIAARTQILSVWNKRMSESRDVFLQYTSKKARLSNGWKKWQGELRGLRINNVPELKRNYEASFQQRASAQTKLPYASNLLANLTATVTNANHYLAADIAFQEALMGIEIIKQGSLLQKMLTTMRRPMSQVALRDTLVKIVAQQEGFYKNYDAETDKLVFGKLMPEYFSIANKRVPQELTKYYNDYRSNATAWAKDVFDMSILTSLPKLQSFAENATISDTMRILADPVWRIYQPAVQYRNQALKPNLDNYQAKLNYYNRLYVKAQMTLFPEKVQYPDANLTLRLTYGQVDGINPDGPAGYSYQTNLDQVIQKNNPEIAEFQVPQRLLQLYEEKDYGRWAVNGTVPVCFIASNHTSGGNSGSPVLNSKGQLIGTNFDRIWEGTMSDLYFDPKLCRNISVDIRYTLFIIEKFGKAEWLLKEMKLVR
jgi:hypothetical protein